MKLQIGAAFWSLALLASPAVAQVSNEPIDEIVVAGHSISSQEVDVRVEHEMLVDTAVALKNLPGANVNTNGAITGIAQYRGMYGDRVAITIDDHSIISGGPNAMDAPLSYVSPMIAETLVVERGIASVSSGPETIGGHIKTTIARGDFGTAEFGLAGMIASRYSDNASLSTTAGRLTLSNDAHRVSLISEIDNGSNISTPAGDLRPSNIDRRRYDVSYAYTDGKSHFVVFAGQLDTLDSGTPALPMDIRYIETDLAGAHFLYATTDRLTLEGALSFNDVAHVMDNFALRGAPAPMAHRQNFAQGDGTTVRLAATMEFDSSSLKMGVNANRGNHDSTITNPNNAAFQVNNFSGVSRELSGLFAEWTIQADRSEIELGVAAKRVATNAGDVAIAGMMGGAGDMLADAFNIADRNLRFDDIDVVAKFQRETQGDVLWSIEAAQKSRAPAYQELYLWLPMQSTGGLADGRSYIGDLNLKSEKSTEVNIGLSAAVGRFRLSPQVFFKSIDGFIQGVPSSNATANMVSMMMTGLPALQFANTDAEIYGLDVGWDMELTGGFRLDGVLTYARGRRVDVSDNLYRLAPPNASIGLTYESPAWSADARIVAYASQKKVSAYNGEKATAGYELLNLGLNWSPTESLRLEARINNVFDERYQEHLAGINRASGSDILVGERLYGSGRTITAGVIYSF